MILTAIVAILASAEPDFAVSNAILRNLGSGPPIKLSRRDDFSGQINCSGDVSAVSILIRRYHPRKDGKPRTALDAAELSGSSPRVALAGGIPVGEDEYCHESVRSAGLCSMEGPFSVVCTASGGLVKSSGIGYDRVRADFSSIRPKLETLVRWICAENAGRRAKQSGTASYAGHSLTTYTVDERSVIYASISAWGSAMGWAVRTNQDAGTVYLTKGSHRILAPVGTNAMKVDGKWIRTRGVTFYKNGTYYADVANLP